MIHSGVEDNWLRVKIMHGIAYDFYLSTKDSEYREARLNPDGAFHFSVPVHELMRKEACVVGMLMAWSVVTLESLVNHALADTMEDREMAIQAIEFARQFVDENKIKGGGRSELGKKLQFCITTISLIRTYCVSQTKSRNCATVSCMTSRLN